MCFDVSSSQHQLIISNVLDPCSWRLLLLWHVLFAWYDNFRHFDDGHRQASFVVINGGYFSGHVLGNVVHTEVILVIFSWSSVSIFYHSYQPVRRDVTLILQIKTEHWSKTRTGWSLPFLDFINLLEIKSYAYKDIENVRTSKLKYMDFSLLNYCLWSKLSYFENV